MNFKPRASGTTVRRSALPTNFLRRRVEHAVVDPHDARERFDPEFLLAFQCSRCQKVGQAPRRVLQEATRSHATEDCPLRHVGSDDPIVFRVFYPKQ